MAACRTVVPRSTVTVLPSMVSDTLSIGLTDDSTRADDDDSRRGPRGRLTRWADTTTFEAPPVSRPQGGASMDQSRPRLGSAFEWAVAAAFLLATAAVAWLIVTEMRAVRTPPV